jgi:ketosteroid isomerase-like protein
MVEESELICFYELTQAKARYCRALDAKDWAALAEMLTDDMEFDLAADDPAVAAIVGRANVLQSLEAAVAGARTVHQVHMPEIDLRGDEADVSWAVQERVVWDNGTSLTAYGRYDDRWVRSDNRWKLASLRLTNSIMDFT